jgi:hypothetical protein
VNSVVIGSSVQEKKMHAAKALDTGWPVLMDGVRRHLERSTETKDKTNE